MEQTTPESKLATELKDKVIKPKNDSMVDKIGTNSKVKPEAHGVTVQGIIDATPDNSKYIVLASLVSSISCSVIGTASSFIGRVERMPDVELHSMERHEILTLMLEADMRQDMLRTTRGLVKVREHFADQLLAVANDDQTVSWSSSVDYMTTVSNNSRVNKERLFEAFKACGIVDDNVLEIMYQSSLVEESGDRIRNAELIAQRRGSIEWLIENIFHGDEYINESGAYATDKDIPERIEDLPAVVQERLYEKVKQAVSKAMTRCAGRFAIGDTRYELTDVVALNDLVKQSKLLIAMVDD